LIFIFQYKKEPKERDEFADKLSEVEAKKEKGELPDHTEFLIKYMQYSKQISPVLTDEAWFMLTEFYKKVNAKGFGSPRVLKTLKKLSKAIARLKLKNIVDEEEANETMEFYNTMLVKFQKSVVYSESPKFLAYKKGVEIVKRYEKFGGITLEQIFETMCKEDKQLAVFFRYDNEKSLKIQDNHKTRDVKELLLAHSNIKRTNNNPITLKWFDSPVDNQQQQQPDEHDKHDKEKKPNQEKNIKKDKEQFNESGLEPTSDSSDSSFSIKEDETIKGLQLSKNGPIHLEEGKGKR
jgi:DNA replicative helicase MCM subunit Mcm2 (Cdc46/Mcm family)